MNYAIITNPVSGKMSIAQKRAALAPVASILDCDIHGLDTTSADELKTCAQSLAKTYDVLVVAGGDGTFSDIINAIDTQQNIIAYLPMGTGNAMRHALHYRGHLSNIATQIKMGSVHEYDLINCDNKKRAFMLSIGMEGVAIQLREAYLKQGITGFKAYLLAALKAYFKQYQRTNGQIRLDHNTFTVKNLLTLIVIKHPYYGYHMKVVPQAKFDDRQLHVLCINSGFFKFALGAISAFTIGNRFGQYATTQKINITLDQPLVLQIDGNMAWQSDHFEFQVLPKALKIKC